MKRFVAILGLAALHFVVTLSLLVVSLGLGFARFDAETWTPPSVGERVVDALAEALMFPAYQLHELLPGPWAGLLEFPLLLANSLLWGAVFYLVARGAVRRVRRPATEGRTG